MNKNSKPKKDQSSEGEDKSLPELVIDESNRPTNNLTTESAAEPPGYFIYNNPETIHPLFDAIHDESYDLRKIPTFQDLSSQNIWSDQQISKDLAVLTNFERESAANAKMLSKNNNNTNKNDGWLMSSPKPFSLEPLVGEANGPNFLDESQIKLEDFEAKARSVSSEATSSSRNSSTGSDSTTSSSSSSSNQLKIDSSNSSSKADSDDENVENSEENNNLYQMRNQNAVSSFGWENFITAEQISPIPRPSSTKNVPVTNPQIIYPPDQIFVGSTSIPEIEVVQHPNNQNYDQNQSFNFNEHYDNCLPYLHGFGNNDYTINKTNNGLAPFSYDYTNILDETNQTSSLLQDSGFNLTNSRNVSDLNQTSENDSSNIGNNNNNNSGILPNFLENYNFPVTHQNNHQNSPPFQNIFVGQTFPNITPNVSNHDQLTALQNQLNAYQLQLFNSLQPHMTDPILSGLHPQNQNINNNNPALLQNFLASNQEKIDQLRKQLEKPINIKDLQNKNNDNSTATAIANSHINISPNTCNNHDPRNRMNSAKIKIENAGSVQFPSKITGTKHPNINLSQITQMSQLNKLNEFYERQPQVHKNLNYRFPESASSGQNNHNNNNNNKESSSVSGQKRKYNNISSKSSKITKILKSEVILNNSETTRQQQIQPSEQNSENNQIAEDNSKNEIVKTHYNIDIPMSCSEFFLKNCSIQPDKITVNNYEPANDLCSLPRLVTIQDVTPNNNNNNNENNISLDQSLNNNNSLSLSTSFSCLNNNSSKNEDSLISTKRMKLDESVQSGNEENNEGEFLVPLKGLKGNLARHTNVMTLSLPLKKEGSKMIYQCPMVG